MSRINGTAMHDDPSSPLIVHITNAPMGLLFLTGQAGFFRTHGFELKAVSAPGRGLIEFGKCEGIAVHGVEMSRRIAPLQDLVSVYYLWRLLRWLRPTIVHAHTPKGGILGMTAAWLAGAPVRIYHLHSLPRVAAGGAYKVLLRWSGRITGRLAHRVICVSHSIRRAALDERLFPAEKARVLARGTINGVDSTVRFNPAVVGREAGLGVRAALGIPAQARVLGFVGRVVVDKGVVELAEAWRDLRERYSDMHLLVLGPLQPEDPIPAEVQDGLAGDPRVHLVGWMDDTPPYYAAMDLLALPSYREGFPYALLEAASMQLPVVATTVPGCVDAVVDGVTGALVRPFDARALAGAVAAYMDDPGLRQEHGRAGRERVDREFGQQAVWEALLAEYRELLDARPGTARRPVARAEPSESG
jgi:glycosyltransferase involved in cell wall biosynthesis